MARKLSMTPRAVKQRANLKRERDRGKCMGCGKQTTFTRGNDEYYMVHDDVWLQANPKKKGMLCIGCLEDRLGRQLTSEDFTDCMLNNHPVGSSPRLVSRLETKANITGMYELLDALKAVIASADPQLREKLVSTFMDYEEDFPEEFAWATGAQAPTLLNHLMICCQPVNV